MSKDDQGFKEDQSFEGTCPTCGQPYCGNKIEQLRAALDALLGNVEGWQEAGEIPSPQENHWVIAKARAALVEAGDGGP